MPEVTQQPREELGQPSASHPEPSRQPYCPLVARALPPFTPLPLGSLIPHPTWLSTHRSGGPPAPRHSHPLSSPQFSPRGSSPAPHGQVFSSRPDIQHECPTDTQCPKPHPDGLAGCCFLAGRVCPGFWVPGPTSRGRGRGPAVARAASRGSLCLPFSLAAACPADASKEALRAAPPSAEHRWAPPRGPHLSRSCSFSLNPELTLPGASQDLARLLRGAPCARASTEPSPRDDHTGSHLPITFLRPPPPPGCESPEVRGGSAVPALPPASIWPG